MDRKAEAFLRGARVARLATVDAQGRPHAVPIVFGYAAGKVYTPVDLKPKAVPPGRLQRVRNVSANPNVQVLIDRYDEDWRRLGYLQLRGRADLIERGYEYRRALRLLERKYPQYRDLPLEGRPVIRIAIERAVTWGRLDAEGAPARATAHEITVDGVKRVAEGDRVSLRARVVRAFVAGTERSVLVGDASGLTRVAVGARRVDEGASYAFENCVVRAYEGGWRSLALDRHSRVRRLRDDVAVSVSDAYVERVVRILGGTGRARARRTRR